MAKSISEVSSDWKNKVNNATGNVANKINSSIADGITKAFGGTKGIADTRVPEKYHINTVDFRSKLEVECPEFMRQCGISKIDFGSVFLRPQDEAFIAQTQGITNDVINSINGFQQFISPAALQSVQEMLIYIATDLVNTVVNYCTNVFLKYTSPEFPIGLATDIGKGVLRYTTEYTKSPDEILKEICQEKNKNFEDIKKQAEEAAQKTVIGKINGFFEKTMSTIKPIMDEIQGYSSIISEYMVMGPDYVCSEVEALYRKYLNMGIDIVDENIRQIEIIINEYADWAALEGGMWAASLINNAVEKQSKKIVEQVDTGKAMIKIKVLALVNKTIMNLLAALGG
jgi:hypothetical protein